MDTSPIVPAGLVLAGGTSRRMGRDKALLSWKGETLLEKSVETLGEICREVFVSSSNPAHAVAGVSRIPDAYGDKGPLGGLVSAFSQIQAEWLLLLPCDMPGMTTEAFEVLLARCSGGVEAVVFEVNGFLQPQIGVYNRQIAEIARGEMEAGNLSLKGLLEKVVLEKVVVDSTAPWHSDKLFQNINSETDWQRFKQS